MYVNKPNRGIVIKQKSKTAHINYHNSKYFTCFPNIFRLMMLYAKLKTTVATASSFKRKERNRKRRIKHVHMS